jgi:hypothetical protein
MTSQRHQRIPPQAVLTMALSVSIGVVSVFVDGPSALLASAAESSVYAAGRADQRARSAAEILASVDARDYAAVVWDILAFARRTDEHVVLRASFDVPTAAAFDVDGDNLILYNPLFMTTVAQEAQTDWAVVYVIAHEVAHQLAGHTRVRPSEALMQSREMELEADELSGLVLGAFGAPLSEARRAVAVSTRLSVLSVFQALQGTDRWKPTSLADRLKVMERGWRRPPDAPARAKP